MTLREMKKKVLGLIEELNPESRYLTDDVDIQAKINDVINQVMIELSRFKKVPKYVELDVTEGDTITFEDLEQKSGYEVYQISLVSGVDYVLKASGTRIQALETGRLEVDLFVYPERITEKTVDSYEFELSADVLELMPYGVAADLLKSDVSAEYGSVYAQRFESMLQRLDGRYQTGYVSIVCGTDI